MINDVLIDNINESQKKATYIEKEKTTIAVTNLAHTMLGAVTNCIIISIVLWNVIPHKNIIVWGLINVLFVCFRYVGLYLFKLGFKKDDLKFWKWALIISFFIAGLLFGSSGFLLIDPTRPEYYIFLYFVTSGMIVAVLGSYYSNLMMFFAYSSTIFFLPTIAIYNIHSPITTPMVILGIIFFALCSINAKKMNKELNDRLRLQYDNELLLAQLALEKKNTERLNAQLTEQNVELKDLTCIDPLTQLKNRRYLFDIFTPENTRLIKNQWFDIQGKNKRKSDEHGYGIFMLDIDKFKRVNDTYGHDSGDMILKQFSAILVQQIRTGDVVVRLGGEEFLIILKNTAENSIDKFAERLRSKIENTLFSIVSERQIHITSSIGYIFHPLFNKYPIDLSFEQMISFADKGLYHAKNNGRNICVRLKTTEQETCEQTIIQSMVSNFDETLEKGQIYFHVNAKLKQDGSQKAKSHRENHQYRT